MKILMISILAALSVNANEVVYGSKHGTFEDANAILITEVAAGEIIQILGVTMTAESSTPLPAEYDTRVGIQTKHGSGPVMAWQEWYMEEDRKSSRQGKTVLDDVIVGPCQIFIKRNPPGPNFGGEQRQASAWQVSYKITKPSASGTTTSAPILLPPAQDAAQSWFVNLQVSSDLKTWEDVQPGQFLGSDSARFFRIKTSEQ